MSGRPTSGVPHLNIPGSYAEETAFGGAAGWSGKLKQTRDEDAQLGSRWLLEEDPETGRRFLVLGFDYAGCLRAGNTIDECNLEMYLYEGKVPTATAPKYAGVTDDLTIVAPPNVAGSKLLLEFSCDTAAGGCAVLAPESAEPSTSSPG